MLRIIGIDPGLRATGYGIIDVEGGKSRHVASGCVRPRADSLPQKLGEIFSGVSALIQEYQPVCMSIEQVFVNRNVDSALKLGQARGAAICAGIQQGLEVGEYSPRQIKQAIVGTGGADKKQVEHMVRMLVKIPGPLTADAADALAIALTHAHTQQSFGQIAGATGFRRGRWV